MMQRNQRGVYFAFGWNADLPIALAARLESRERYGEGKQRIYIGGVIKSLPWE